MSSADAIGGVRSLFADDEFHARHLGPSIAQEAAMLEALGYPARADLIDATVPVSIRLERDLALPDPVTEASALAQLRDLAIKPRFIVENGKYGGHGRFLKPVNANGCGHGCRVRSWG